MNIRYHFAVSGTERSRAGWELAALVGEAASITPARSNRPRFCSPLTSGLSDDDIAARCRCWQAPTVLPDQAPLR